MNSWRGAFCQHPELVASFCGSPVPGEHRGRISKTTVRWITALWRHTVCNSKGCLGEEHGRKEKVLVWDSKGTAVTGANRRQKSPLQC